MKEKKLDGRTLGSTSRKLLENFMIDSHFSDLGFMGSIYTWRNNNMVPVIANRQQEVKLQIRLQEPLKKRKDMIWQQKSREILWLGDGDVNTKFFHLSTMI